MSPLNDSPKTTATLKIAGILVVFSLFAFLAHGAFGRVPVEIDGRIALVGVGDSVAEIVAEQPCSAQPGNLLAASDRHVVVPGGGKPLVVRVNGRAADPAERIRPGDRVATLAGTDVVEPTNEETRVIAVPTEVVGSGAMLTLAAPGSAGVQRVVVGAVSGDVIASETVLPATPMVLRRVGANGKKVVALTFDDGPWPEHTAEILDILKEEEVPATFFMLGLRVKKEPEVARRIVAEGHDVGNHTYRHVDLTDVKPEIQRREIRGTNNVIRATTGVQPEWFRPPMGQVDSSAYREIKAAGLRPALWTVDPQDWRKNASAGAIAREVVSATKPGSVILLHDGGGNRSQTTKALPWIIHELHKRGYEFVLLGDLPSAPKSRW
jgi:peptidoglycan/xylan/chitin deacetylase (PgdA/CDA1 family)